MRVPVAAFAGVRPLAGDEIWKLIIEHNLALGLGLDGLSLFLVILEHVSHLLVSAGAIAIRVLLLVLPCNLACREAWLLNGLSV